MHFLCIKRFGILVGMGGGPNLKDLRYYLPITRVKRDLPKGLEKVPKVWFVKKKCFNNSKNSGGLGWSDLSYMKFKFKLHFCY